jgi:metal-sulfur cluster biosynthetic enzyme
MTATALEARTARIDRTVRIDDEAVRAALGTVRDPELDEPITDLRFVAEIRVDGPDVAVDLRLPTYFCAPNFAYLMVADARDAVAGLPGVGRVSIRLVEHFASEEINSGVAADGGFQGTFPGLADDELAELRAVFEHKAHIAAQERVAADLLRSGWTVDRLVEATLADAADSPQLPRLLRRREALGLPTDPGAAVLVDDEGVAVPADALPVALRFARATRVSIDGNSGFCRGLLRVRYGLDAAPGDEDT